MREILFRGKTEIGNQWVTGSFVKLKDDWGEDYRITKENKGFYEVIPETIGQYTDLKDKNGKKIFEGDIVELTDVNNDIKWTAIVVFGNSYGTYCWGWNLMYVGANPKVNTDILLWVDMEESGAFIEVIGNVTDNPELLEVER